MPAGGDALAKRGEADGLEEVVEAGESDVKAFPPTAAALTAIGLDATNTGKLTVQEVDKDSNDSFACRQDRP